MMPADDRIEPMLKRRRWNGAPIACTVFGAWLFIWALLLPGGSPSRIFAMVAGLLITIISAVSVKVPLASWLTTLVAGAFLWSTILYPPGLTTVAAHNAMVAMVIMVLSIFSTRARSGMFR